VAQKVPRWRTNLDKTTPSQTIGPFFSYSLTSAKHGRTLLAPNRMDVASGVQIGISGQVFDGDSDPISDAMLEIWQADQQGRLAKTNDSANIHFRGFSRTDTDLEGTFVFETVKPGRLNTADNNLQAPHINVMVFARGILTHLCTRIYFADEASNKSDPVLAAIPDPKRRKTLIAVPQPGRDGRLNYRFDIRLQGEAETVFFQWS